MTTALIIFFASIMVLSVWAANSAMRSIQWGNPKESKFRLMGWAWLALGLMIFSEMKLLTIAFGETNPPICDAWQHQDRCQPEEK